MTDLHDLIELDDLEPGEEERLRRAHELLLQAGPPPELPPSLLGGSPRGNEAEIAQFPLLPRRRAAASLLVAAAIAAVAFGGGFLVGNSKSRPAAFTTQRLVLMHAVRGPATSRPVAQIRVAARDSAGNRPLEIAVSGLPRQPQGYYELWLTRSGKPYLPCGAFRIHGDTTTVRFTVPYALDRYDGWVLTAVTPTSPEPGTVVMTT